MVPANGALGIANREYVTNEDRSAVLDPEKLARVKDPHVAMALRLAAAFGLRREEAIKFTPARDDRGERIRLKGSTTKGGRPREVPVRNETQTPTARRGAPPGGRRRLDPAGAQLQAAAQGLRESDAGGGFCTACMDFDTRTPSRGTRRSRAGRRRRRAGPPRRSLTGARRRIDTAARKTIARELGHDRASVSSVYVGA